MSEQRHLDTAVIEARLAAATPGPWRHTNSGQSIHPEIDPEFDGLLVCEMPQAETEEEDARNIRNFELIAHAPADIRALLDEVRELRELVKQAHYEGSQHISNWAASTARARMEGRRQ